VVGSLARLLEGEQRVVEVTDRFATERANGARYRRDVAGREIEHARLGVAEQQRPVHADAIVLAQQSQTTPVERARARRRHRDQAEGTLHPLERVGFLVRRELSREAEEQLLRPTAPRQQPDADLDEAQIELGVGLDDVRVE
jgi:hypothetical protein